MQATPNAPSVVMSAAGERRQVPLRDYLNSRIAPFLKKAMTQSLEVEAEHPLQWLGEYLINQSILYEGNPDPTNIKDHFRYNFDAPAPAAEQDTQNEVNGTSETAAATEADSVPAPTIVNGEQAVVEEKQAEESVPEAPTPAQDTEMGGTS